MPDERRLGLAIGALAGMSGWGWGVGAIERDRLHAAHAAAVRVQYTCGRRMNAHRNTEKEDSEEGREITFSFSSMHSIVLHVFLLVLS